MGRRPNQRQPDMTRWSWVDSDRAERAGRQGPRQWAARDVAVAETIGAEVRRIRRELGLSQRAAAAMINVSQVQWLQYEKGRDQVSLSLLLDMEDAFGLERGHLFRVVQECVEAAEKIWKEAKQEPSGTRDEDDPRREADGDAMSA